VAGADPPATPTDPVIAALLGLEREAGTEGAAEARRHISEHMRTLGFQVEVQRFAFSTGTLNALPVFGAGLGWLTVLAIPLLLMHGAPAWAAIVVWLLGLAALVVVASGIALGWAPSRGERREDANLIVRRPEARVRRWIVAHVDTKAQRQGLAGRLVTLGVAGLGMTFMAGLAIARLFTIPSAWLVAAGITCAAQGHDRGCGGQRLGAHGGADCGGDGRRAHRFHLHRRGRVWSGGRAHPGPADTGAGP
jgi:hypothetical protein